MQACFAKYLALVALLFVTINAAPMPVPIPEEVAGLAPREGDLAGLRSRE